MIGNCGVKCRWNKNYISSLRFGNNTEAPLTLLLTYPRSKERGFTVRKRVVALPWDVKSALADISALHPRTKVQGFAPIFHKPEKYKK